VVKAAALESAVVRDEAQSRRRRKPLPENPDQQAFISRIPRMISNFAARVLRFRHNYQHIAFY
jgi:hypothetical protein